MWTAVITTIVILGLSIGLLAVRTLCGRGRFEMHDVDDIPSLRRKGICCPRRQDLEARGRKGFAVAEHSKHKAPQPHHDNATPYTQA